MPARGKQATLHAHLVARDDSLSLYGFASEEERDLFLHLISVSGIGPKVAIAILSGGAPRELLRAIAAGDAKRFQAVPGIGKRTAERLIVELREKVAGELEESVAVADGDPDDPRSLARDGLMHLGYTLTEAEQLLDGADGERAEMLIALRARRPRPSSARPIVSIARDPGSTHGARPDPVAAAVRPRRWPRSASPGADDELDRSLRPPAPGRLRQPGAGDGQLEVFIEAARRRGEPLDHVLLAGPPGLGKTSLAHIVAAELEAPLVQTAGPGARAQGRHRRLPHRARARLGLLHRRGPPPEAGRRGDALPGDGGAAPARRARPGRRARAP